MAALAGFALLVCFAGARLCLVPTISSALPTNSVGRTDQIADTRQSLAPAKAKPAKTTLRAAGKKTRCHLLASK